MALHTTNYNLEKQQGNEVVSIDGLNENFDIIDENLKEVEVKAITPNFQTAGGTATAIILADIALVNGNSKTFLVAFNNNSAATTINGKPLYKPNTTTAPNLTVGKAVTVWYNSTVSCFFIKASAAGNATAENVLASKTFSNDNDTELTGTMPNNGAVSAILSTEEQEYTVPAGYHNGLGKVKTTITNLLAGLIKAGVTVGGILGTFTSDATATAAQMLLGAKAYINGVLVTGTIPSKAAATINPSTSAQTIGSGQYLSGTQTIAATTGTAVAANVLAGKTFNSAAGIGLTGTMAAGKKFASGSIASSTASNVTFINTGNVTSRTSTAAYPRVIVSGLTFLPRVVVLLQGGLMCTFFCNDNTYNDIFFTSADYANDTKYTDTSVGQCTVIATGFNLPVMYAGTIEWIAYE